MFFQIFIGSVLICITIIIQVIFIEIAMKNLRKHAPKLMAHPKLHAPVILLTTATLWLLTALSLAIWVWAHAFNLLGAFDTLEQALYFSMVAFTTLGFGDVTLPQEWRLLSGMIAANGLVLFGLNTAFLIETLSRVLKSND
ncbi:MAG: hypothetical protein COA43_16340 [Robiginitomaculum sp.]|nr:MAG: hypothetical protein COA43_16340 [Robiginitomaculum sp.]